MATKPLMISIKAKLKAKYRTRSKFPLTRKALVYRLRAITSPASAENTTLQAASTLELAMLADVSEAEVVVG